MLVWTQFTSVEEKDSCLQENHSLQSLFTEEHTSSTVGKVITAFSQSPLSPAIHAHVYAGSDGYRWTPIVRV